MPRDKHRTELIKELTKELHKDWNDTVHKLIDLMATLKVLTERRDSLLSDLDKTSNAFHTIRSQLPDILIPKLYVPLGIRFASNPNLTIGDAMEMLIKERGALTQREIIDELRKGGFNINLKNPHVVLANAVKKDARNRFKRLDDGRVINATPRLV